MKKMPAIVLMTALAGVSIHAARSHQEMRSSRSGESARPANVTVTKQLNQMSAPAVSAPDARVYEPAVILRYSQPQSVTPRLVTR